MDETASQPAPARDNGHVILRIILALAIVGLSVIDLLFSSQTWVLVASLGIIIIAVAFATGTSWARRVMGIVSVVTAFGYAFSAINGGGQFAITNALIWAALFLGVWYVNGEFSRKRPRSLS